MTKNEFIQYSDADLVEQLWESYIFPEDMPHREFLKRYRVLHIAKYGKPLRVIKKRWEGFKNSAFAPMVLIPFGVIYFLILHFIIKL